MRSCKTLITLSLLAGLTAPLMATDVNQLRLEKKRAGAYEPQSFVWTGDARDAVCDAAEVITFGSTVYGDNLTGTNHGGWVSADVIYRLVVPERATVTLSTCNGPSFDAYMHLFNVCPMDAGAIQMAHSDDVCGMLPEISMLLDPGEYFVMMEGFNNNTGSWMLEVTASPFYLACEDFVVTELDPAFDTTTNSTVYLGNEPNYLLGTGPNLAYSFTLNEPMGFYVETCLPGTNLDVDLYLFEQDPCLVANWQLLDYRYEDGPEDCDYHANLYYECFQAPLPAGTYYLIMADYSYEGSGDVEYTIEFTNCNETVNADEQPLAFSLGQAVPNPFNPSTTIAFSVAETAAASLTVYDLAGHAVATLVDGFVEAGSHSVVFDGSQLASGVYVYTLQSGASVQSQKMVLVK